MENDATAINAEPLDTAEQAAPEAPAPKPRKSRAAKEQAPKPASGMSEEELEKAVANANFTIKEQPENPDEPGAAMMFDADTKVTPALVLKRIQEEEERKKKLGQGAPVVHVPRIEKRAGGRREVRYN